MPIMEISIKWNVCRVCLVEERQNHTAKYTKIDTKIAKQIHDIAGVEMESNDNLPDKICRKCLVLLKYACHFSTTCRNSDEYLQSIIRKTKSATSMLKFDKQRERSVELMNEIFNCNSELVTINLVEEDQEHSTIDTDLNNKIEISDPKVLPEKIGDSVERQKLYLTQLIQTVPDSPYSVLKIQHTHDYPQSAASLEKHKQIADVSETSPKKNLESLDSELIDEDYEENEMDNFNNKKSNYNQHHLGERNNKPECSMDDLGYTDDFEEVREDTLDIMNDESEQNVIDDNEENERDNLNIKLEQKNVSPNSEDYEHNTETEAVASDLFYVIKIEEPALEIADSLHAQDIVAASVADGEGEDGIQLIDNMSETECCGDGEERDDENSETNKSMAQLEEYLIDESDVEIVTQQEFELTESHQASKRPSSTTIKINEQEHLSSPNGRKRVNDAFMFSCDVCGNHFTSRSLRNYHMRIHRNERNFECELCFKRFTAACNLTAHMRIHTGEKPYECNYCLRRFTDRSTHIKHERIHTNEKPFQCNTCGKSFALSTTLRTHEKVHSNEKPFKCVPCNKSFKLPHQLKSHLHTNLHKNVLTANEMKTQD